jgi:hypothetical protein
MQWVLAFDISGVLKFALRNRLADNVKGFKMQLVTEYAPEKNTE